MLKVAPLPPDVRAGFVAGYLQENFHRRLDAEYVYQIATQPAASNALFLRTLLDELVASVKGIEEIPIRLGQVRADVDAAGLFGQIFERMERELEADRPGLVGDALRLLSVARHGLGDQELMDLLGTPDGPLPSAYWSPLALQLRPHTWTRPGLMALAEPALRAAVERHYLSDAHRVVAARNASPTTSAAVRPRRALSRNCPGISRRSATGTALRPRSSTPGSSRSPGRGTNRS